LGRREKEIHIFCFPCYFFTGGFAMIPRIRLCLLLIIVIVFAFGMQKNTYTVTTVEGVKFISNIQPQWGNTQQVSLQFVQKIGSMDATDPNYIMYQVSDVVKDSKGDIYIVDSGNARIQVFNATGKYKKTIGRKGEGPGEFSMPFNININSDGALYIGDYRSYRFLVLEASGKEIKRVRMQSHDNIERCRLIPGNKIVNGGFSLITSSTQYTNEKDYWLFLIINENGETVNTFGKPEIFFESRESFYVFSEATIEVDKDGNIYIAYRYKNRIEKYDSNGTVLIVFDRPTSYKETLFRRENNKILRANSFSMGIGIDTKERIWVLTMKKKLEDWEKDYFRWKLNVFSSDAVFEIFSKDGILLGSVPVPENLLFMRICGDRLFIIDHDQVSVSEYKIVDK
jgi:hypothetical protein